MATAHFRQDRGSLQFAPVSTTPCCLPDSGAKCWLPFIIMIVQLFFLFLHYFPFLVSLGLPSACVIIWRPQKAPEFAILGLNQGGGEAHGSLLSPRGSSLLYDCSSGRKSAGRQPQSSRGRTCIQVLLYPVMLTAIR